MNRLVKPGRLAFCALLLISLTAAYVVALYKLQIIEGAAYAESSKNNVVTQRNVPAPRGNILDRYGRVLISNRACNNILIKENELFAQEDPNEVILKMVRAVRATGGDYIDTLPITMTPPFEYTAKVSDVQRILLDAYILNARTQPEHKKLGMPEAPSAVDLMAFFRDRYKIDNNYTAEETRIIAGIRYEINIRYIVNTSPYVFCEDASIDVISRLMENDMPGFDVEVNYIREYNTMFAAHILGYVGQIYSDEAAKYEKLGYPLNAMVGKEGAEVAFESYLHGKDGKAAVSSTVSGIVTGMYYVEEPIPGNHVYLTLDIKFQEAVEAILRNGILSLNQEREKENAKHIMYGELDKVMQYVPGGAVVVLDLEANEPLVIASYPTFDPYTFLDIYDELLDPEKNSPLFNRALLGQYPPGSTFKMATAIAALDSINETTGLPITTIEYQIRCEGIYREFQEEGYAPRCWVYPYNHGEVALVEAIQQSCNYYFYTVGRYLGIDRMSEYAMRFGLGSRTGIELPESRGVMSTQEFKLEHTNDGPWRIGDTIQAAIGQSYSEFTPLQIAVYLSTIVNDGVRYGASLLKTVRSYDYSRVIYERQPEILDVVTEEPKPEYYEAIKLGMRRVVTERTGTAYLALGDYPYPIAAKTGTAQLGSNLTNNGVFICYAPYDNPKIAIAVVIEKGGAGSGVAFIARQILDYYFDFTTGKARFEPEMSLLR